jgi:hypothetical protein
LVEILDDLASGKEITARDIMKVTEAKMSLLTLSHVWYTVTPASRTVPTTTATAVVDLRTFDVFPASDLSSRLAGGSAELFEIPVDGGSPVAIVVHKVRPVAKIDANAALELAAKVTGDPEGVRTCEGSFLLILAINHECKEVFLKSATDGQLKAALQKAIRFGSRAVSFRCLGSGTTVPTTTFACATLARLFASGGSWNPDMKLFIKGSTSALKVCFSKTNQTFDRHERQATRRDPVRGCVGAYRSCCGFPRGSIVDAERDRDASVRGLDNESHRRMQGRRQFVRGTRQISGRHVAQNGIRRSQNGGRSWSR